MELSLSAEMGVEAAGVAGYRPLPAAKAVFVLHGFLFQAQESETGRLRRPAGFGIKGKETLEEGGGLLLGRVLPGPALFLMERGAEDGFSGSKEAGRGSRIDA